MQNEKSRMDIETGSASGKFKEVIKMKLLKHSCTMLLTVGMMAMALTACGGQEAKTSDETTTAVETKETTTTGETTELTTGATSSDATITEDEAINLVRKEMGEDYSYIPADELEEKDGSQYYVIYVKKLLDEGTMTTMATYMVKTDGSVLFDKDAVNYAGEYVRTGDAGEVTFVVSEDGTFEMITTGDVNQVVSGRYKLGITDSASVVKLILYPNKTVTDGKEETVENVEGTAVIEGDKLTLTMESIDSEFTKK